MKSVFALMGVTVVVLYVTSCRAFPSPASESMISVNPKVDEAGNASVISTCDPCRGVKYPRSNCILQREITFHISSMRSQIDSAYRDLEMPDEDLRECCGFKRAEDNMVLTQLSSRQLLSHVYVLISDVITMAKTDLPGSVVTKALRHTLCAVDSIYEPEVLMKTEECRLKSYLDSKCQRGFTNDAKMSKSFLHSILNLLDRFHDNII